MNFPEEYNNTNPEKNVKLKTRRGKPLPLGATVDSGGVNFSIFSRNAVGMTLELYQAYFDEKPSHVFQLDSIKNKTGDIWHIYIEGIECGQFYGYRAQGPYEPHSGMRFNPNKLLTDPYARAISGAYNWDQEYAYGYDKNSPLRDLSYSELDSARSPAKSIVVCDQEYDWEGEQALRIPMQDTVIYEMHVRFFTESDTSQCELPGTFHGITEKIDHLKELGVTTIELMPIFEFNVNSNININPDTGEQLINAWGYDPLAFFAVESSYTHCIGIGDQVVLFKDFMKAMHKAGIEVLIDVVYNHTGEGGQDGPTLSFRGLDNAVYYLLNLQDKRFYMNYSGCGNTLNCNKTVVKQMIIDSLRYWVTEMHIDGFRFDLAAILGRSTKGEWIGDFSLLKEISDDPILSKSKLIAEGWDAGGGYYVGEFPKGWAEWNGKFRDVIRRFIRGDKGMVPELATRIAGSSDLYDKPGRKPFDSINFITAHDGFTMWDLISYNNKHNDQNGEDNRDGTNDNFSYNHGVEGETDDPEINALRKRQMKNMLTILMVSQGIPMILMGDEMCRTQKGNNNAYCHDNEITWMDWTLKEKNREIFDYFKNMIRFRKNHNCLRREHFFTGKWTKHGVRDITWHGIKSYNPDWGYHSHTLAFVISGTDLDLFTVQDNDIYVAMNFYDQPLDFELPMTNHGKWYRVADTSLESGKDFVEDGIAVENTIYRVREKSIVVMLNKRG
ncbi:MAG TPA: glycogen debranching protein GlgX [Thermotogota bacterium]|nr:glycogen debranching protein GlgX [Thermotogota bacterium]HPJ88234.1 glycogen debranching protein GlgX [Thermotogota bacterium]HPR96083.1 glycogen debranching protein GlgX [Thermotogota bacterium]